MFALVDADNSIAAQSKYFALIGAEGESFVSAITMVA